MNKLKILMGMLAAILLLIPSVYALEGESPAEAFDRLTEEGLLIIVSMSAFFIVLGAVMLVFGGASPTIRAWGARIIVFVLLGNFVILIAPWVLEIIRPGS